MKRTTTGARRLPSIFGEPSPAYEYSPMADRRRQVFRVAARELSFTKTGDILYMTQPAVSLQVTQLEETLNVRLFDRLHYRIRLTAISEQVYRYAEANFDLYDDMERTVRALAGDGAGSMLLGAGAAVADTEDDTRAVPKTVTRSD